MENRRILVVDDERDLREILEFNLESEGYLITTAQSGEEAIDFLKNNSESFDLILLDIMMGGDSGLVTAKRIRAELKLNTPIIFLTAKVTENDVLTGFSIGADDYITKPFSIKELTARVKAVIRRVEISQKSETNPAQNEIITIDNVLINTINMEVRVDGELIPLTRKEYHILMVLATSNGRTFSREEILAKVWQEDNFVLERTVDVHITRLRKKLGRVGNRIVNRSGYGYCLREE